jgi:hypothetical protein
MPLLLIFCPEDFSITHSNLSKFKFQNFIILNVKKIK